MEETEEPTDLHLLGYFDTIPVELHRIIFLEILDPQSLMRFFCVCRSWSFLAVDQVFWKEVCENSFDLTNYSPPEECPWSWVFLSKQPFTKEKFTGMGKKVVSPGCTTFEGEWLEGELHGKAICTWQTGDQYVGEWAKGERSGQGTCVWNAGDTYVGAWKNNRRNGYGVLVWKSKAKYQGEFVDDARHGYGIYTWSNGDCYEGEWKDSKRTGKGKIVWDDGNSYVGDWFEGNQHGEGVYQWQDGDKFEGGWKNNTKHGTGKYTWGCGDQSEGKWENDVQVGEGKLVWRNGNTFFGEWVDGAHETGEYLEKASGRVFWRRGAKNSGVVISDCHTNLIDLINTNQCTFTRTGEVCYFQYLWKTKEIGVKTHGVCVTCKNLCVPQNGVALLEPQHYFGGNFWCDCGSGNLAKPCRAMQHC